jgi:hypothetical protein
MIIYSIKSQILALCTEVIHPEIETHPPLHIDLDPVLPTYNHLPIKYKYISCTLYFKETDLIMEIECLKSLTTTVSSAQTASGLLRRMHSSF